MTREEHAIAWCRAQFVAGHGRAPDSDELLLRVAVELVFACDRTSAGFVHRHPARPIMPAKQHAEPVL